MPTTTTAPRRCAAIAICLAGLVLAGCGGDDTGEAETVDASATAAAPATTEGMEPTEDAPDASAPETASDEMDGSGEAGAPATLPASGELDGRRVTVEDMGSTTLSLAEPAEGTEVIFLEVTVENVSAEPWNSNMVQFFLVDGDGNEIGPELLGSEAGDNLPDIDALEQGQSSTGFIAYQVPPDGPLTLSYAVDLSAGMTIDIPLR